MTEALDSAVGFLRNLQARVRKDDWQSRLSKMASNDLRLLRPARKGEPGKFDRDLWVPPPIQKTWHAHQLDQACVSGDREEGATDETLPAGRDSHLVVNARHCPCGRDVVRDGGSQEDPDTVGLEGKSQQVIAGGCGNRAPRRSGAERDAEAGWEPESGH